MADTDSIRTNILLAIQGILEDVAPITPTPVDPLEDWPFTFSKVELGPLTEPDFKKSYVAGIVPGVETKKAMYPLSDCFLPVIIEFQAAVNRGGLKPLLLAEQCLTLIQRAMAEDTTLGLEEVADTTETRNEIDLETYETKGVVGLVQYEVRYRHSIGDPRVL